RTCSVNPHFAPAVAIPSAVDFWDDTRFLGATRLAREVTKAVSEQSSELGVRAKVGIVMSAIVKVFGCRPLRTFPRARRPASENLQGTKPRGGHVLGGAARSAMGI